MRQGICMAASSALAFVALLAAVPAAAQDASEAEIDALVDAAATPQGALAAARRLEGEGDAIGAAATLERALYAAPADAALPLVLYRIALLCRLGDTTTARAEGRARRGRDDRRRRMARDQGLVPRLPPARGRRRAQRRGAQRPAFGGPRL
ncbi:MAG: hypothetical protein WDN24_08930 [Sphingomonas sp.]